MLASVAPGFDPGLDPSIGGPRPRDFTKSDVVFCPSCRGGDTSRVPGAMQREALLRRTGIVTNAGVRVWYGPGSAAHHAVKDGALHCVRGTGLATT